MAGVCQLDLSNLGTRERERRKKKELNRKWAIMISLLPMTSCTDIELRTYSYLTDLTVPIMIVVRSLNRSFSILALSEAYMEGGEVVY